MTSHIRWQIVLILSGILLVAILLTYLAINYTTVLVPSAGGTYVEGTAGFPSRINPLLCRRNQVDCDASALVFSGLTRLNDRGELEPDLARSWEVDFAGRVVTYTFHIRTNAYWHDGMPVTADDVVFTVNLVQDPSFPNPQAVGSTLWRTVAVQKVDIRTVRFTLPEAYAPFLDYTTLGILPAHVLTGTTASQLPDAAFNLNPVGSGPFQIDRVDLDGDAIASIVLKRFPRYYGTKPLLERVQLRYYANREAVLNAYESGEIAGIASIPNDELEQAYTYPDLELYSAPLAEYGIVFFNMRRTDLTFLHDPVVRQAMLHAVDRQAIINEVLGGQAVVAHSPMIPGTWAYKDDLPRYEYDPAKAEQLLNQAGWIRQAVGDRGRRKEGTWFRFQLLTSNEPERAEIAQRLVDSWASLGISVTLATAPPEEVRAALENREFEAILVSVAMPGDPDPYPLWHETQVDNGQNYSGFSDRRMSELIEQARTLVIDSASVRRDLYYEFQDIFAEQVPALLLYLPVYTYGVDTRVNDVQIGPMASSADRFYTIADWWIVTRRTISAGSEAHAP
ncbi:MAG: peptide ABC transporter substrate-binding protein [Anaerolineales bacterium]|nr:peptide ABC transporter substrate-binding protein [Anaerolineales bacterium]